LTPSLDADEDCIDEKDSRGTASADRNSMGRKRSRRSEDAAHTSNAEDASASAGQKRPGTQTNDGSQKRQKHSATTHDGATAVMHASAGASGVTRASAGRPSGSSMS
jgi:hypothetical protein